MLTRSRKAWFTHLGPADAARLVVVLERTCQHDWRRITRTPDRRLALRHKSHPDATLTFGAAGQDIATAVRDLNRQFSSVIVRRCTTDRSFRDRLLIESAQALLNDDLELAKGLLRRLIGATVGFDTLAHMTELHPKSLIRMLSRYGNPSARHLSAIIARLSREQGLRLAVTACEEPRRGAEWAPNHVLQDDAQ